MRNIIIRTANQVYEKVSGMREVYLWPCSQIGWPIDQPPIASAQLILHLGGSWRPSAVT